MLQSEFEERYGKRVTPEYYQVVEEIYIESPLQKDAFVEWWKKAEKVEGTFAVMESLVLGIKDRSSAIENMKQHIKEQAQAYQDKNTELAQWLIEKGFYEDDEDIKQKAVQLIGEKAYIQYVMSHDMEISNFDRKIITKLVA